MFVRRLDLSVGMSLKRSQRVCAKLRSARRNCVGFNDDAFPVVSVALLSSLLSFLLASNNARQKKKAVIEVFQELSAERHVRGRQQGTRRGARVETLSGRVRTAVCTPTENTFILRLHAPSYQLSPQCTGTRSTLDSQCIPGNVLSG